MPNSSFYKKMLDNIYEGIYFVDNNRQITFWNKGAERITGFTSEEVLGRFCYDNILKHVDDAGNHLCLGGCPLHKTIEDGQMRDSHVYLHHKDGHRVTVDVRTTPVVENNVTIGAVEMFVDQGGAFNNRYAVDELEKLALMDQLTGLPNRRYLDTLLANQMDLYMRNGVSFGLAFLDIDHFKRFNDTYGHLAGDRVLKMVAKTLTDGVRSSDIVGRWGGEEFIAIFPSTPQEALAGVAEKIRMLVENSALRENGETLSVTISSGATAYLRGESAEELVRRADRLLYQSKQDGRNRVTVG